jgi:hypothetical protein
MKFSLLLATISAAPLIGYPGDRSSLLNLNAGANVLGLVGLGVNADVGGNGGRYPPGHEYYNVPIY